MDSKELKDRTKKFAKRCIRLTKFLPKEFIGNHIANQLTRSSLSTAANYRATCYAQSKEAFTAKISIVLEEADESLFWIEIIEEENLIPSEKLKEIKQEALELTRIFAASRTTIKKKTKKEKQKSPNN